MSLPRISKNTAILSSSCIIAVLSCILYFETTKNAKLHEKISTIASNMIINFLAAKNSIDYLHDSYQKGEYKKGLLMLTLGSIMYTPQVLISILESSYNIYFTVIAAASALLSGAALYVYSLIELWNFFILVKNETIFRMPYGIYKLLGHLNEYDFKTYQSVVSNFGATVNNITYIPLENEETDDHTKMICIASALSYHFSANAQDFSPRTLFSARAICSLIFGIATSFVLVYSTLSYTCGSAESLSKNLHLKENLAIVFSNILMFCMYVLNIKGGFLLASSSLDYVFTLLKKGKNENQSSLTNTTSNQINPNGHGSKKNVAVIIWILSVFISSFSGASAKALYDATCPKTKMKNIMFQRGSNFVYYSECADNAIYVGLSLLLIYGLFKKTEEKKDSSPIAMAHSIFKKIKSSRNLSDIQDAIGEEAFLRFKNMDTRIENDRPNITEKLLP